MSRLVTLFIFFLAAVAFSGCRSRSAGADRLDLAESLMWSAPDSALAVLDTVSPNSLAKGEERARYALLYTMAMDKNYLEPTNDSLIASAVDYYKSKDNAPRLMVANYYRGRVQQHNGRYPQALLSFYQAKDLAEKSDSSFWAGMACRGISDIYGENYNRAEELAFAKKEYEYIKKSGRQPYLNYALLDLGRAYGNNGSIKQVISISRQLIDSAEVADDPYLHYCALQMKAHFFVNINNYAKAYPILIDICNSEYAEDRDLSNLCLVLAHKGEIEEAMSLLDKLSGADSAIKSMILYGVYRNAGQFDKAIKEVEYLDSVSENILKISMSQNLAGTLSDYFEINQKINDAELKATQMSLWLLTISFIVVVGLIIFIVLHFYQRQQQEINQKVLFAEQLGEALGKSKEEFIRSSEELSNTKEELQKSREALGKSNAELISNSENLDKTKHELFRSKQDFEHIKKAFDETRKELDNSIVDLSKTKEDLIRSRNEGEYAGGVIKYLLSTKYELLEQLSEIVRCSNDSKVARKKIADAVTKLINDLSIQSDKIAELKKEVDTLHDNLFSNFYCDLPNLKDADYRLFLFSVLHFSTPTISLFLNEDKIDAVYNRKKRLKDKIKLLDQEKANRYLQYLS